MDYFKIFTLIFMIFITYKLYSNECKMEGFDGTTQSLGGVDDTNAINTLAQIAKNLMAGGVTIPGNITVSGDFSSFGPTKKNRVSFHTPPDGRRALYIAPEKMDGSDWEWGNGLALDFKEKVFSTNSNNLQVGGNITTNGEIKFGGDNAVGFRWDNEGGNGWACLRAIGAKNDDSFCMHNTHGGGTRLLPGGDMTVKGRNILAELTSLQNQINTKVSFGANMSIQAMNDQGQDRYKDLGESGSRTNGGNSWSIGRIQPR